MKRWVRAILLELKARGVNFHLFMTCRALANKAEQLKKEREKAEVDNLILESRLRELQRLNQEQRQQLFTQDFTVLSLRGELARANKLEKENEALRAEITLLQSQKQIVISIKGEAHERI